MIFVTSLNDSPKISFIRKLIATGEMANGLSEDCTELLYCLVQILVTEVGQDSCLIRNLSTLPAATEDIAQHLLQTGQYCCKISRPSSLP